MCRNKAVVCRQRKCYRGQDDANLAEEFPQNIRSENIRSYANWTCSERDGRQQQAGNCLWPIQEWEKEREKKVPTKVSGRGLRTYNTMHRLTTEAVGFDEI